MKHIEEFLSFIKEATSPIQSVNEGIRLLETEGFRELKMHDSWSLEKGKGYYIKPYPTSLFAFKVGQADVRQEGFRIITSHTDNPGFKLKPNPEMPTKGYLKLNTELYCQPMFYSWLDRPLSLAGHVVTKGEGVFSPRLVPVDIKYPLMTIPSLAIHYNREVNKGAAFNPQTDMLPLVTVMREQFEAGGWLLGVLEKESGVAKEEILDYDLYIYVQEEGSIIGSERDMILAPRVDNQASVLASLLSLIASSPATGIAMAACFDNEEIGSATKQGADSTLLLQILERIGVAMNKVDDQLYRMYADSFMISADGAHALHPNAVEKMIRPMSP